MSLGGLVLANVNMSAKEMLMEKLPSDLVQVILDYLTIFEYNGLLESHCGRLSLVCLKRWQNVRIFFDPNLDRVEKFGEFVTEQLRGIPTKDEYDDDLLQHPELLPSDSDFCFIVFPCEYSWELALYILWKRMFFGCAWSEIHLIRKNKVPLALELTKALGDKLKYDNHNYNMIPISCPKWAKTMVFTFAEDLRLIFVNDFVFQYSIVDKLIYGAADQQLLTEKSKLSAFKDYFHTCKPTDFPHRDWFPIILPRINNVKQLLLCLGLPSVEDSGAFSSFKDFDNTHHLKYFVRPLLDENDADSSIPHDGTILRFSTSLLKCFFAIISDVPLNMGGNRYYFLIGHSQVNSTISIGFVASTFEDE
eukprot:NODE_895_length_3353_cov_0.338045.p1 type:complete len:363 gc:universal NODE_895_length_3353_cov_0.338045:1821-733(-)